MALLLAKRLFMLESYRTLAHFALALRHSRRLA